VLGNGEIFLYFQWSSGIPDDYDDLDSQTIEALRAETTYKVCNRHY
jgi:hypothetical protein